MTTSIDIVGMACRYPDASSPDELWENVLAQRQAFRRIPRERMPIEDYCSDDETAPDRSYSTMAAVITGWNFDRTKFRISRSTYDSADVAHWLALDVAAAAVDLARARGVAFEPSACGVIVGNTLTGDASRAASLRLRWPYVRRVIEASLLEEGWSAERRARLLESVERRFKSPFAAVGEETLAGALSNTIAGRICGYFGFGGGGFTVDGACASSLLAVAQACAMLTDGDLDVALAGGVDVSLDPFELTGFAKTHALARSRMWVYDGRSNGFLPGEGCGFVVLMRHEDALRSGVRAYATIRGWGISSDGEGGITRPEVEGQRRALERAYRRAGVAPSSVAFFEGHGTGTAVGDRTEIAALQSMLADAPATPALGSVKANIGHTKAAAGIAGLIKATMAVSRGIVPPTTGCAVPHPDLTRLRIARSAQRWGEGPRRAGVSAFGFGGLNTHVVIESEAAAPPISANEASAAASAQDLELFLLGAPDAATLAENARRVAGYAEQISMAEMRDLAATLAVQEHGDHRAAILASTPEELRARAVALASGERHDGLVRGVLQRAPRIALLFSGQAAPVRLNAGAWGRRFPAWGLDALWEHCDSSAAESPEQTAIAQPAIVASSLAALRALRALGIDAAFAIGHSLGELTALHWGGAISADDVLRLASARGAIMQPLAAGGAMAAIAAPLARVAPLLRGGVVVAAINAPEQSVISGPVAAVASVCQTARSLGLRATQLPVSAAFHSPAMAGAAAALRDVISSLPWRPIERRIVSTVTGASLAAGIDVASLLAAQLTSPVRFLDAVRSIEAEADLFIEAGPGNLLGALVATLTDKPAVSLDAAGDSLSGLLKTAALLFTCTRDVNVNALCGGRFVRRFDPAPRFIASLCELTDRVEQMPAARPSEEAACDDSVELVFRRLIGRRTELPVDRISGADRLLADLHLNSIAVSQLVAELTSALAVPPVSDTTQFAGATVADVAKAIEELRVAGDGRPVRESDRFVPGVDNWVRTFTATRVRQPLDRAGDAADASRWTIVAEQEGALVSGLRRCFASVAGNGVVAVVPSADARTAIKVLLNAARRAPSGGRVVFVQDRDVAGGFARCLFIERDGNLSVRVVNVPSLDIGAIDAVMAEARGQCSFAHAHYDAGGVRFEEHFRLAELPSPQGWWADDVLLVSGGGKGIASEIALHIARSRGVRVILLGRSDPLRDAALAASLERFRAAGVRFHYAIADVTDAAATKHALTEATAMAGPVTALLHGAGTNVPQLIEALDESVLMATFAPKVTGLIHLLAAVDVSHLRALIALGSVISRSGMRGEGDYAIANEWLRRTVDDFAAAHPHCRAVTVESSVWSGAGMGERLGRIEALRRAGIAALTVDEAVAVVERIASSTPSGSILVTGRLADSPTIRFDSPELPLARFLEHPRVVQHGVEIVADSRIDRTADPYLDGHRFHGTPLFPAAMGIEAMLQAASATLGCSADSLSLENVAFDRPVIVAGKAAVTLRVATLVQADGSVAAVIRSSETEHSADHFRATCRRTSATRTPPRIEWPTKEVPLDVQRDLYDALLFQREPFQRVLRYLRLSSTECAVEVQVREQRWFAPFLPSSLAGGDSAARDAAMHAIQACIPHVTVLPAVIERIDRWRPLPEQGSVFVVAQERARHGDRFVYDLDIATVGGEPIESWRGLLLRVVERRAASSPLPPALWGPFLERELPLSIPGTLRIAAARDRGATTESEAERIGAVRVLRRGDGKPLDAAGRMRVSASHAGSVRMTVTSTALVAVDLQEVDSQPWEMLLDAPAMALARMIAAQRNEAFPTSAARVWSARECGKKLGLRSDAPLVIRDAETPFVRFGSGQRELASTVFETTEGLPTIVTIAVDPTHPEGEADVPA